MVHTNPEFETSNLILDFEFDQHLESHKHVINIIMWFRDMGCYSWPPHILASDVTEEAATHSAPPSHCSALPPCCSALH
jgi:hypothetical protein